MIYAAESRMAAPRAAVPRGGPVRVPPVHARAPDHAARERDRSRSRCSRRAAISSNKRLVLRGEPAYFRDADAARRIAQTKVAVSLEFENSEKRKLGMPLPKGIVRVYKRDKAGGRQFLGEDEIDHTPRDEKVRIRVGDAFDVVGERKQMDYKVIGSCRSESAWQIDLRNHKDERGRGRRDRARRRATGRSCRRASKADEGRRAHLQLPRPGAGARQRQGRVPRARSLVLDAPAHARGRSSEASPSAARGRAALRVAQRRAARSSRSVSRARTRPMRDDTLVLWMSSVKPLMSVAIGQLVERGLVGARRSGRAPPARVRGEREGGDHAAPPAHAHRGHSQRAPAPGAARAGTRSSPRSARAALEPGWVVGRDCALPRRVGLVRARRDRAPPRRTPVRALRARGDLRAARRRRVLGRHGRSGLRRERARASRTPTTPAAASSSRSSSGRWNGSAEALALCRPGGSGWGTARALGALLRDAPRARRRATAGACSSRHRRVSHRARARRASTTAASRPGSTARSASCSTRRPTAPRPPGTARAAPAARLRPRRATSPRSRSRDPERGLAVALAWNGVIEPERHARRLP